MSVLNLFFIVFLGILIFFAYFHISNSILDFYQKKLIKDIILKIQSEL